TAGGGEDGAVDHELAGRSVGAEAGREVHDGAEGRVVEAAVEADHTEGRTAVGEADAVAEVVAGGLPAGDEPVDGGADGAGHGHPGGGRVGPGDGVAEVGHDPV